MERLRVRSRNGPARDDPVRHPRHPPLCAKRPAVSPPVRMKFSVNWLREFVDLPENPEEIADLLTRAGVETQNIETRAARIDKVIVSQITASSRHPNADRLTVCEVDDGSGTKRQIVCGATNYKVGDKVPLALPGAKLPDGTEIKKNNLRGVESEGMLCSPIELGMGEDASGLLILSPEAKIGTPIGEFFPADTILDVEVTPNRGDLLSHFGLAREIAALTEKKLKSTARESKIPVKKTGVTITSTHECPFFSARKIDNVTVGPSPQWLRIKIESVGTRSINNIVDISNFIMLELGQPTHAFDANKLNGGINVRLAREGEKFLALDGKTYSLKRDSCVVADQKRAVGIGGVMGGEETAVTDSTKNILLEAAYFLPASIRRTARELNLPSDASYRFERGVDPEMVLRASQRASELSQEIAGGTPAREINVAGKLPENHADVALRPSLLAGLLGVLDHNIRAGAKRVAIFETGRVFEPPSGAEKKRVAILLWGNLGNEVHWRNEKRPLDFFDLKSAIELTRNDKLSYQRGLKNRNMALTVDILTNHDLIGVAGQLSNALSSKLDASGGVFVAEVSLDFPTTSRGLHATFREFGKFPAVTRDIAMIVPETLSHEEISNVILQKEPLLETVAFFDRVVGKEAEQLFGPGKKSVAYRLTYRDRSRTLTSEEVNAAHAKIRERLRSDLGAELRE